jgi:hypothetical protein
VRTKSSPQFKDIRKEKVIRMKKIIKWLRDNLDRDLYEYYEVKKGERI